MAAKVFEVGDVLPATTQLEISWGISYLDHDLGVYIKTTNSYLEINLYSDRHIFDGYIKVDGQTVTSIYEYPGEFIIDTSSWNVEQRTIIQAASDYNMVFYWEDLNPQSGYSITFEENGGSTVTDLTEQTNLPSPLPTTTKANHVFAGWYYDNLFTQKANAGDELTTNVTLYAKWYTPTTWCEDIADAIREKDGTTEPIKHLDFPERILTIATQKEEETKTVTPDFSSGNVVVTPTSGKVMSQVTINKDSNLIPENIKAGVTIFGVTGTLVPAPSGFTVLVTWAGYFGLGVYNALVYDGQDSSGILLETYNIWGSSWGSSKEYNITSGYLYIKGDGEPSSGNYWVDNPSVTGGVSVISKSPDGEIGWILCGVNGNGTLNTGDYSCFIKGTPITLANGMKKNVEDITYDDKLLTWNFDEGKLDTADIVWIAKENKAPVYWEVVFSDNTVLGLVGAKNKSHRLFNVEQGKFVYPQDFNDGEHTIKEDGTLVTITSCTKKQEEVTYYNLATSKRLNNYANGILTGCRFTNIYPIENMKYVKDNRPLVSRDEYQEIPDKYFYGLRLAEQPLETNKGDVNYFNTTKEHVIHNYIEHEKDWQGNKDYKTWEFKKGK